MANSGRHRTQGGPPLSCGPQQDGPVAVPAGVQGPTADLDAPQPTPSARLRAVVDLDAAGPPPGLQAPARRGTLRIGIIGTGVMAAAHAENFQRQEDCRLEACLDIDPRRSAEFAKRFAIPHVAKDGDDLLARCDAVAVVTSDDAHAAHVVAALRRNRHVLCEKPLTRTFSEARTVARAARKAAARGVVGMVNFSYRCAAAMHHAAWMRRQGALGDLRHVSAQYLQGWLCATHEPSGGALWRLRRADGGGVLADLGCHLLDMVTAIAGEVERVHCQFGTFPKVAKDGKPFTTWQGRPLDADDTALVTLAFADGGMANLQLSRWAAGRKNTIRVDLHGTRGALVFDLDHSYDQVHHYDVQHDRWQTEHPAPAPSMWHRFVAAIRAGRADQPDLLRGAQVQAYLEACRASAASGKWESVPAWE